MRNVENICYFYNYKERSTIQKWDITIWYWRKISVSGLLCLTLRDPMHWSPPGSSVYGIFQATILEWVVISFSSSVLQNIIYNCQWSVKQEVLKSQEDGTGGLVTSTNYVVKNYIVEETKSTEIKKKKQLHVTICAVLSRLAVPSALRPHGLQPTRLLRHGESPGKSTGVGCHALLMLLYMCC